MAEPTLDIGGVIKEKLADSIKNMDVLSMLQKMVATTSEDEESEEIRGKLQGVLAQYEALEDEDKEQFTTQLKNLLASKIKMKLDETTIDMSGFQDALGQAVMYRLALVGFAVFIFIILLVFFGYKLYKSIVDKEKKREEKKKIKQMKKKK